MKEFLISLVIQFIFIFGGASIIEFAVRAFKKEKYYRFGLWLMVLILGINVFL